MGKIITSIGNLGRQTGAGLDLGEGREVSHCPPAGPEANFEGR